MDGDRPHHPSRTNTFYTVNQLTVDSILVMLRLTGRPLGPGDPGKPGSPSSPLAPIGPAKPSCPGGPGWPSCPVAPLWPFSPRFRCKINWHPIQTIIATTGTCYSCNSLEDKEWFCNHLAFDSRNARRALKTNTQDFFAAIAQKCGCRNVSSKKLNSSYLISFDSNISCYTCVPLFTNWINVCACPRSYRDKDSSSSHLTSFWSHWPHRPLEKSMKHYANRITKRFSFVSEA